MAGPPYKWQWVEDADVDRSNGTTDVTIYWRSISNSSSKPETEYGKAYNSCGDCIVWFGAGLVVDGEPLGKEYAKAVNVGIPNVNDSGSFSISLPSEKGELVYKQADVYTEAQWMDGWFNLVARKDFQPATSPKIENVSMPSISAGETGEYSFRVVNQGGTGEVDISVDGVNAQSQEISEALNNGDAVDVTGTYEIPYDQSNASIDIVAESDQTDKASTSTNRKKPRMTASVGGYPEALLKDKGTTVDFTIENAGGADRLNIQFSGDGFENIDESIVIGENSSETISVDFEMPVVKNAKGVLNVTGFNTDLRREVNIERIIPDNPQIRRATMVDVEAGFENKYSFQVINKGGKGTIEVSVDGTNAESFTETVELDRFDTATFEGSYEVGFLDTEASIDITAAGEDNTSETTRTSSRIGPDILLNILRRLESLCEGDRDLLGFEVVNKGGRDRIDISVDGPGVQPIDKTVVIESGERVELETDFEMPDFDIAEAEINVSSFNDDLSELLSVSRINPNPQIEVNYPDYMRPGKEYVVDVIGTVEDCIKSGRIGAAGDIADQIEGQVSPGRPLSGSFKAKMPAKSSETEFNFGAGQSAGTGKLVTRPENAVLIDSTQGVGIHAPQNEVIEYDMVVIGSGIKGKGDFLSPEEIDFSRYPDARLAELLSSMPFTRTRYVKSTLEQLKTDNVIGEKINYIGGRSQTSMAIGIDGEYQGLDNTWSLMNPPVLGPRLELLKDESTLG